MNRSNRLACGYSIIHAADIHQFLGLSMLSQLQPGLLHHDRKLLFLAHLKPLKCPSPIRALMPYPRCIFSLSRNHLSTSARDTISLGRDHESSIWIRSVSTPCPGEIRPTVIDEIQPIESIGSRLRNRIYVVVEAVDFNIQLLYTLN